MIIIDIQTSFRQNSCDDYASKCKRFFKTAPGEYGAGDIFLGIKTPIIRKVAKINSNLNIRDVRKLVRSKYHEERLLGLFILVNKYSISSEDSEKEKVYQEYINNFKYINNWDLVDVTCPHIIGKHLLCRDRAILYEWIRSNNLWVRRIAMISNWWFVRKSDLRDVFKMAELLIEDKEDLIHKAVGWMLREAGKKNISALDSFLKKNYQKMPRVMLRYAIEKMSEPKRKRYLKGEV